MQKLRAKNPLNKPVTEPLKLSTENRKKISYQSTILLVHVSNSLLTCFLVLICYRIKHVCARLSNDTMLNPNGCATTLLEFEADSICTGKPGDNFDHGYTTFDTYCEFLAAQCRIKFYEPKRKTILNFDS